MIAVVDAGLGNLRSVEKALAHVGGQVEVTSDPRVVGRAERVVVPGQGGFGDCARALAPQAPLGAAVRDAIDGGRPYLGICLGLQLLFAESEEAPGCAGLGILPGRVVRIPAGLREPETGFRAKVPHMGWNVVLPARQGRAVHPLLDAALSAEGNGGGVPFYFVHSYHAVPETPRFLEGTVRFGGQELAAAVGRDNLFAVQFHPEKSQRAGLALLSAFLSWRC